MKKDPNIFSMPLTNESDIYHALISLPDPNELYNDGEFNMAAIGFYPRDDDNKRFANNLFNRVVEIKHLFRTKPMEQTLTPQEYAIAKDILDSYTDLFRNKVMRRPDLYIVRKKIL
jgi:hypothetical protein